MTTFTKPILGFADGGLCLSTLSDTYPVALFHSGLAGNFLDINRRWCADGAIIACNMAVERFYGRPSVQLMVKTTCSDPHWRASYEEGSPFTGGSHLANNAEGA